MGVGLSFSWFTSAHDKVIRFSKHAVHRDECSWMTRDRRRSRFVESETRKLFTKLSSAKALPSNPGCAFAFPRFLFFLLSPLIARLSSRFFCRAAITAAPFSHPCDSQIIVTQYKTRYEPYFLAVELLLFPSLCCLL